MLLKLLLISGTQAIGIMNLFREPFSSCPSQLCSFFFTENVFDEKEFKDILGRGLDEQKKAVVDLLALKLGFPAEFDSIEDCVKTNREVLRTVGTVLMRSKSSNDLKRGKELLSFCGGEF